MGDALLYWSGLCWFPGAFNEGWAKVGSRILQWWCARGIRVLSHDVWCWSLRRNCMSDPPRLIPLLMLLIRGGMNSCNESGACGSCTGYFTLRRWRCTRPESTEIHSQGFKSIHISKSFPSHSGFYYSPSSVNPTRRSRDLADPQT